MELACYSFDIEYHLGRDNVTAVILSRAYYSAVILDTLEKLHNPLSHFGITWMMHFVRLRNLPFSVEDVKRLSAFCTACAESKPQFYWLHALPLIKVTMPCKRLSVDYKEPLPSYCNRFLFTQLTNILISALLLLVLIFCRKQLSNISPNFGLPIYVHLDRGSSFMSTEVKTLLHKHRISTCCTIPHTHPPGNGQYQV